MGANSFLYEMNQIYMEDKDENDIVASPESGPVHLNLELRVVPRKLSNQNAIHDTIGKQSRT